MQPPLRILLSDVSLCLSTECRLFLQFFYFFGSLLERLHTLLYNS